MSGFVAPFREIDVSGKLPLSKRPGLLAAIEMVEAGQADHIVVAYFDRLVRSLKVQLEVIERVEKAGGEIFALDHGKLTNGTAAQRLSTNMMGAVFQYFAEVTGEKVTAAQARAVARGVYPLRALGHRRGLGDGYRSAAAQSGSVYPSPNEFERLMRLGEVRSRAVTMGKERRLLYVAMTRAKDKLNLIVPQRFYTHHQARAGDRHDFGRAQPLHPRRPGPSLQPHELAGGRREKSRRADCTGANRYPGTHAREVEQDRLSAVPQLVQ